MNRNTKENLQQRLLAIRNVRFARKKWGISREQVAALKDLTTELQLSVAAGHLKLIENNWYVTHAGLLGIARRNHCSGIRVRPLNEFSDATARRWVFKATVYKSSRSRGFVGFGDADPSNVSSLVQGAEMRVAETRAVARALRKAFGVGVCSVEELGWAPRSDAPAPPHSQKVPPNGENDRQNGQRRLRDRLCLLIRQYKLDANLVKAYAADYCGTPTLREARRDQVEAFINDLSERAAKELPGLICQLNSYGKPEARS